MVFPGLFGFFLDFLPSKDLQSFVPHSQRVTEALIAKLHNWRWRDGYWPSV